MKKYNLIVVGGGLAGVAAALANNTNKNAHTVDIKALRTRLKKMVLHCKEIRK